MVMLAMAMVGSMGGRQVRGGDGDDGHTADGEEERQGGDEDGQEGAGAAGERK